MKDGSCQRGGSWTACTHPEGTEAGAEGETGKAGGPTEGRKGDRVDWATSTEISGPAESTRPERRHKKPPWGQNASRSGRIRGSGL